MNPAPEVWKPVVGYEGHYEVSDQGRVRSLKACHPGRVLKPFVDRGRGRGRRFVALSIDDKSRRWLVHRLVLEAFVGPCPAGMEGAHNNGNTADNRPENLRWDSHLNNMRDAHNHGTARALRGTANSRAKLSEDQVWRIVNGGEPWRTLADLLGVSKSTINSIRRGENWSWLTRKE